MQRPLPQRSCPRTPPAELHEQQVDAQAVFALRARKLSCNKCFNCD